MKKHPSINKQRLCTSLLVGALAFTTGQSAYAQESSFQQRNLVANVRGEAARTDANLVNPWGLAFNPFGPAWVANNGSGVSTIYNGTGNSVAPRRVQIPSARAATGGRATGIVFNGSSEFIISQSQSSQGQSSQGQGSGTTGTSGTGTTGTSGTSGTGTTGTSGTGTSGTSGTGTSGTTGTGTGTTGTSGTGTSGTTDTSTTGSTRSARFIFATEDGVIAAWSPAVNQNRAIRVFRSSVRGGAVYKGLALSANGNGSRLYATDFRNNKVDVFNGRFRQVNLGRGSFTDPTIPRGFAPYGIQAINGAIYVTYARQSGNRQDVVKGRGQGYVSVFSPNGKFIKRVASRGRLNAPWGMALAPADFGEVGNHLLVANFGDGTINAHDTVTGRFVTQLTERNGNPMQIDGLWGIAFGSGFQNQPTNTLFFAAGPNNEQDGLYGRIDVQETTDGQTGTGTTGTGTGTTGTGTGTTGTGTGTTGTGTTGTGGGLAGTTGTSGTGTTGTGTTGTGTTGTTGSTSGTTGTSGTGTSTMTGTTGTGTTGTTATQ